MGARPRTSWQTMKGVLIHRAVLAAAGKPLTVTAARRTVTNCDGGRSPELVSEAQWVARRLTQALQDEDAETAWALIDAGGPRWVRDYENYCALSRGDRRRALEDLEHLAVVAAEALLERATTNGWTEMLSEVLDPVVFLGARRGVPIPRLDLLVRRHEEPLIVDLKTGAGKAASRCLDSDLAGVRSVYGEPFAREWGGPVACQVLYLSFDGGHRWSPVELATERTRMRA